MSLQRTLKKQVDLEGIGLHSGSPIRLRLFPAAPNSGIVFVRSDLPGSPEIPAHHKVVVSTQLATTLGLRQVTVSTVEHLLAALQGTQIDNVRVEVDGAEIPIMDGSAVVFYRAIQQAGIQTQNQSRAVLALRRKVELKMGEKWAIAEPSSCLEIHGSVEWDHPMIGYQEFHYQEGKTPFDDLAPARTFGFLKDVEMMKKAGLARGGSLDNAVVLDESSVVNPGGLRFENEFARHKVLDALGDFKLAGISIQGFFRLHRAGHDLHRSLLAEIFRNPDHFEILDESSQSGQDQTRIARFQAALVSRVVASF